MIAARIVVVDFKLHQQRSSGARQRIQIDETPMPSSLVSGTTGIFNFLLSIGRVMERGEAHRGY